MEMLLVRFRWAGAVLLAAWGIGAAGCGDVGSVRVELRFPEGMAAEPGAILYRAREVPVGLTGCENLWGGQAGDLRQRDSIVEYPNRTDIRALGIDLAPFESLTLFAFAYETVEDVDAVTPRNNALAGGCIEAPVSGEETSSVVIEMVLP